MVARSNLVTKRAPPSGDPKRALQSQSGLWWKRRNLCLTSTFIPDLFDSVLRERVMQATNLYCGHPRAKTRLKVPVANRVRLRSVLRIRSSNHCKLARRKKNKSGRSCCGFGEISRRCARILFAQGLSRIRVMF